MATLGLGEVSAIQLAAIRNLTTRCYSILQTWPVKNMELHTATIQKKNYPVSSFVTNHFSANPLGF